MTRFPTDDQTLQLLHDALQVGSDAARSSVGDLLGLYSDLIGVSFHVNDVLAVLLAEIRDRRAQDGPIALAEARGRVEALAEIRAVLRQELRGAPGNAPPQSQLTYVGGLAQAFRIVKRRYSAALNAEEDLVIASADPGCGEARTP